MINLAERVTLKTGRLWTDTNYKNVEVSASEFWTIRIHRRI